MRIISGQLGGRHLKTAAGPGYRPATDKVRQALFSMLEARGVVWSDCRILDLYAGSGSLGFEALSRGAREAWFVERMRQAASIIAENAATLGLDRGRWRVLNHDVRRFLKRRVHNCFEVVFVDPPYGKGLLKPSLQGILAEAWLAPQGFVAAEVEAELEPASEMYPELELLVNKTYGQTRICLWQL